MLRQAMIPDQIETLYALALGFSFAAMLGTGYQVATRRPASFRQLRRGPQPRRFAAVPFLVFTAPFIIMRNIIRARRCMGPRFGVVMTATIIAGLWSLMSGSAMILALDALSVYAL
jgi:hypothetical protein